MGKYNKTSYIQRHIKSQAYTCAKFDYFTILQNWDILGATINMHSWSTHNKECNRYMTHFTLYITAHLANEARGRRGGGGGWFLHYRTLHLTLCRKDPTNCTHLRRVPRKQWTNHRMTFYRNKIAHVYRISINDEYHLNVLFYFRLEGGETNTCSRRGVLTFHLPVCQIGNLESKLHGNYIS